MAQTIVGISDCQISGNSHDSLVTYALGSCIGVIIYDGAANVGGLLHFMLPESSIDPEKGKQRPWMFADTGIPALFHAAYSLGAEKRRLVVYVLGGARVLEFTGDLDIGKRNYLATRKILWKAGVMIHAEHVGGTLARTVRLDVANGKVCFRVPGGTEQELSPAAKGGGKWLSES